MPFNALETVRTELEHFMDHSQTKHSASVWSSQLPSKSGASAFTVRMYQGKKLEAAEGLEPTFVRACFRSGIRDSPLHPFLVGKCWITFLFFVKTEVRIPGLKKRFEGRHLHLSTSVSHCFEIPANMGGPSCSCLCGLSLAPVAGELLPLTQQPNPSSVAVPGLCAEVEDVYRTQSLASRNPWSNRGDTGGLDNDMHIASRSWLL